MTNQLQTTITLTESTLDVWCSFSEHIQHCNFFYEVQSVIFFSFHDVIFKRKNTELNS